jgi:hypothetical protein
MRKLIVVIYEFGWGYTGTGLTGRGNFSMIYLHPTGPINTLKEAT